jgi:hypothetical protein
MGIQLKREKLYDQFTELYSPLVALLLLAARQQKVLNSGYLVELDPAINTLTC